MFSDLPLKDHEQQWVLSTTTYLASCECHLHLILGAFTTITFEVDRDDEVRSGLVEVVTGGEYSLRDRSNIASRTEV
jgi:hypothetical protein